MSDHVKPSRLLLRLEAEIANAPSRVEADCKRAERAAYLARLGRVDEARTVVAVLQQQYAASPDVRISSWLHLVLGLVAHFSDMDPASHDRVLRAHALSAAAGLLQLRALTAAWAAHVDYLRADFNSMALRATEALDFASIDAHSTLSRVSLVVAQAFHFAGRLDYALPWYAQVREHATAEGDDATLSALMHNMAWLRGQELRVGGWLRSEVGPDQGYALLGAESVANFDLMIGTEGLTALVPILRAQICSARGRYSEALSLYEMHLDTALREGLGRLRSDLLADQAWCRMNLSQLQESQHDADAAEESIDVRGQIDDRVMAHGRLAQVFSGLGDQDRAADHRRLANEALSKHSAIQSMILELLRPLRRGYYDIS